MEPPAWSFFGFCVRWALSPMCVGGDHRCAARRCGTTADERHRYCHLHEDALVAAVGSPFMAAAANARLSGLAGRVRERLDVWVAGLMMEGRAVLDLTAGEGPAFAAGPGGIVTETASL